MCAHSSVLRTAYRDTSPPNMSCPVTSKQLGPTGLHCPVEYLVRVLPSHQAFRSLPRQLASPHFDNILSLNQLVSGY